LKIPCIGIYSGLFGITLFLGVGCTRSIPSQYRLRLAKDWEKTIERAVMASKYSSLGTPRGRYDEHSSKSFLSCEAKVYRTSRRKPYFRR
jgi:hypothetical protein